MNVKSVEKKDKNVVNFTVEIDAAEFEDAINKAYLKNRKSIYVPGFRKGKAPRMVIEGYYGPEVFHEDALEMLYPTAYEMGIVDEKIDAVGRPSVSDIKIADDKTVTIVFETAVYPEVTLGQYRELEAAKKVEPVTEEELDADIQRTRERNARIETVERPAADGDVAVIDFEGFIDGKSFEGGKGEKHELAIGSGQFIPGFEEQVVGMSAGDEKEIDVAFPEDYHAKELAGKAAKFKVKVNEVKEKQLPELDDEFAKDVSEFDTLDEFKSDARTRLEKGREAAAENLFREALLAKAIENMQTDIPEAMIEEKVDSLLNEYGQNMSQYGMTLEQYVGMMGMDMAAFRKTVVPNAKQQIEKELLFNKIAETENFEISDEAVEEEYKKLAEQYQMEIDKVKEIIPAENVKKELGLLKAADAVYETGVVAAE
ncbi:MAG: trigger factor [Oscillospiraceae bacterium]